MRGTAFGQRVELGPGAAQFLPEFVRDGRAHAVEHEQQHPPFLPAPHGRADHAVEEGLDGEHGAGLGAGLGPGGQGAGEGSVDLPAPVPDAGAEDVVGGLEGGVRVAAGLDVFQGEVRPAGLGDVPLYGVGDGGGVGGRVGGQPAGEALAHAGAFDTGGLFRLGGEPVVLQAADGVRHRGRVARREGLADGGEPGLESAAQDGARRHGLLRAEPAGQRGRPVEHGAGGAARLTGLVGVGAAGAVSGRRQRGHVLLGGPPEDGHQDVEPVADHRGLVAEVAFGPTTGPVGLGGGLGMLPQRRAHQAEGGGVRAAFGVDEGEQGTAGETCLVLLAEEGGQSGAFGAAQGEEPFGGAGPGRPVQQGLGVEPVVAGAARAVLGVVAAQAQAALGERGEGVLAGQPAAGDGRPAARGGRSGVEECLGGPVDVLEPGVCLPGAERLTDDVPAVDRVDAQLVDAGEDRRVEFVLLPVGEDDQDRGAGTAARKVVEDEFVDGERRRRHRDTGRTALAPDGLGGAVPLGRGPQQHDPAPALDVPRQ